mgnify:CR=1 FL=1
MKSAPQRPIFVSVNIKQKYMKLILRLGLILFTGFISISTASAQLYGTADTNAPELRVPTSVKPAFDYWMRDTWATLGIIISQERPLPPIVTFRDRGIAGTGTTVCTCGVPKI